jgi:3-oxoacyl-[acyl-carrier-protein] synthase II
MIQNNLADVVFAGGAEASINPMAMFGFWKAKALSHSPAPKPFDASRDGFVMGEGAGILILESEAHAKKRNATVYAEVVGYGASADAFHITAPRSDGSLSALAIKQALTQAGVQPEEIGYINAHGTGTFFGDKAEYLAIQKVFGKKVSKIPVSSTKSLIGHSQGACGGIEAIACALTLSSQKIHPTNNFNQSDPECKLNLVTKFDETLKKKHVLSINTGFGGNNAALVFKKVVTA